MRCPIASHCSVPRAASLLYAMSDVISFNVATVTMQDVIFAARINSFAKPNMVISSQNSVPIEPVHASIIWFSSRAWRLHSFCADPRVLTFR